MTSREAITMLNVLSSYETKKEKREEYKKCIYAILKDLEVLEIIKANKKIIFSEKPNYNNMKADDFYKLREWLANDEQRSIE